LRKGEERKSPYSGIEQQLLNTFFSGVYISAKEFLDIGREMGYSDLAMKNRELLLKEIIARAEQEKRIEEFAKKIDILIGQRKKEYSNLIETYPKTSQLLSQLIHKATSTQRLIHHQIRSRYI